MTSRSGIVVLGVVAFVGLSALSATFCALAGDAEAAAAERLEATIEKVRPDVEAIRGLTFRKPVAALVIDDAGARRHALKRFDRFYGDGALALEERALALLGVLPRGLDTLEAYLAFLEEQAGGFYDPETRAFYMLDDVAEDMVPMIVSHELTHALEDQHFDLDGRLEASRSNADRVFALSAVHEGSAMLVMSLYVSRAMMRGELTLEQLQRIGEQEAGRAEALADFPEPLIRPMLGTYTLGMSFLLGGGASPLALASGFPQDDVDRSYRDGPQSSEQILHPDKYWNPERRDDPVRVAPGRAGRALGRGFKRRAHGVLGELMLGSMVGAPTPTDAGALEIGRGAAWTNEAASGWGGDRWELWVRGDEAVALLHTVWDTERDAREFESALTDRTDLHVRRAGDRVAIVAGDAGARAGRVLRRLLASSSR